MNAKIEHINPDGLMKNPAFSQDSRNIKVASEKQ